jgi:hypothetical protein
MKKSKERIRRNAEIFTPDFLVNDMLNKFPLDAWQEGKTWLDPACGNGQFLVNVLRRKIVLGHKPLDALRTIYGVDIMNDSLYECRIRLLKVVKEFEPITREHVKAVFKNIYWTDTRIYPKGSLDYDFSFEHEVKEDIVGIFFNMLDEAIKRYDLKKDK